MVVVALQRGQGAGLPLLRRGSADRRSGGLGRVGGRFSGGGGRSSFGREVVEGLRAVRRLIGAFRPFGSGGELLCAGGAIGAVRQAVPAGVLRGAVIVGAVPAGVFQDAVIVGAARVEAAGAACLDDVAGDDGDGRRHVDVGRRLIVDSRIPLAGGGGPDVLPCRGLRGVRFLRGVGARGGSVRRLTGVRQLSLSGAVRLVGSVVRS